MFSFVIYGYKSRYHSRTPPPPLAICVSWKCMLATFAARMKHKKTPNSSVYIYIYLRIITAIIHNNWTKVYTLCIIFIITLHRRNSKFSIYVKITMVTTTAEILRSACAGSCSRSFGHFCFSFERIKELLRQVHTKRTKKTSITDGKKNTFRYS